MGIAALHPSYESANLAVALPDQDQADGAEQRIADVARWGQLPPGTRVTKGDALFPRIDEAS